jgi:hypothetical protein
VNGLAPVGSHCANDKLSPSGKFRTRNAILRIAEQYQSVVIWCQDLNMIVGYADLDMSADP